MNTMMVLGLGVMMGMQHATEADHLAAMATLTGNQRSLARGLRHGLAWGLGHTVMLLLIGGGVGLLGWVISPELAGRFEQVVGAMLIALGAQLAWRLWRERIHFHGHTHDGGTHHFHGHAHGSHASHPLPHRLDEHRHEHHMPARSVLVGMVHGLAGSAAMALLASQAMPSSAWGLLYIALFGCGSIIGMALLSGAVALSLRVTARHLTSLYATFNAAAACISVMLGTRLLFAYT